MKCIDCQEEMSEKEAKRTWLCMGCDGPIHAECVMEDDETERDLCEHCYNRSKRAAAKVPMMRKAEA